VRLIRENRDALDRLARALLEQETLDEQEILRVTQLPRAPRTNEAPIAAVPAAAFSETRPGD
jgi:cell division protease FtsH